jgi:hypothetical protein
MKRPLGQIAALMAGALVLLFAAPAPASAELHVDPTDGGYTSHDRVDLPSRSGVSDELTRSRNGAGVPNRVIAGPDPRPQLATITTVNGQQCRTPGLVPIPVGLNGVAGGSVPPPCPTAPGQPAAPPPTPAEAAYWAWIYRVDLPDPTVSNQPAGAAVTGIDTYLTIGGPQALTRDVQALGYDVHLAITSRYDIAWGDGQTTRTTSQGGPYPSGTLRHQYVQRGAVTIRVTQVWSARWTAGGQSGALPDSVATDGALPIQVQEIQAVVDG